MRPTLFLALAAVQILVGAFVATRPLFTSAGPLTRSWFLDAAFAAFFLIRGLMNLRAARKASGHQPGVHT